jgi:pyroglutamyl-peptidase
MNLIRLVLACVALTTASTSFADKPVSQGRERIVVSGFGPFGGRTINASFQLAKRVQAAHTKRDITLLEVPVVWGAPQKTLAAESSRPWTLWLAFGEGTRVFHIETVADNQRAPIEDNNREPPSRPTIIPDAPAKLVSPFPAKALAQALNEAGLPVRVSTEAGNYLCEEMLFNLLHAQTSHPGGIGIFIHTPVLGARVKMPDGSERVMNEELMNQFAKAILPAIDKALATVKK